jgi:hypothetical protein
MAKNRETTATDTATATTTHFSELDEEETACIIAVVEDKYNQVKDDRGIPFRVKHTLQKVLQKLSGSNNRVS